MSKSEKTEIADDIVVDVKNDGDTSLTAQSAREESVSELDQLRNIVFGSAKADLDLRILELQSEVRSGFEQAAEMLKLQMSEMYSALQESVGSLEDRIGQVDSHYDYKTTEIDNNLEKLAEEVDANDAKHKQLDDDLHKRIDREIQTVTDQFTQKHNQTIDLLNQVKKELNSSKTDRKTLAKLLATVASNLETEDDS